MFDQLEPRQLLSATVTNGILTVSGSSGNDVITLTVDSHTRAVVDIQPEGFHHAFAILNGAMKGIVINGNDGNDRITINSVVTGPPGQRGITINGGAGNDTIFSGSGDDTLNGNDGNDSILGNAGNDVIDGGLGADIMDGGVGTDTITYASRTNPVTVTFDNKANDGEVGEGDQIFQVTNESIIGGSAADKIDAHGDPSVHVITGNGGNDTLIGGMNRDTLIGGDGNDSLVGNEQNDSLLGGAGDDVLVPMLGKDTVGGGDGRDRVDYTAYNVKVSIFLDGVAHSGAAGENDLIRIDVENANGGSGNDLITGNALANVLHGGAGKDTIFGLNGNDTLYGDAGIDSIDGGNHNDLIHGGASADIIHGSGGNDRIFGDGGGDLLYGETGTNTINDQTGSAIVDKIFTHSATDVIVKDPKDVVTTV